MDSSNGESATSEIQRKGPLDIAATHLSKAAEHLEHAKAQYDSAKATYQSAKAVYEAVEASQEQVLNLSSGNRFCGSCARIPLKSIFSKSHLSKQKQRRRVGDLFHAVENQASCSFCKFLIEAFQIGDEQQCERLHAGLSSRDTAIHFTSPSEGTPWFRIAGVSISMSPCPFVWLQTGPPTTTGVPHICISFVPASGKPNPDVTDQMVYPRMRHPIQAFNGSLDYHLINAWMRRCTKEHGPACERPPAAQISDLNIYLIDVKTRQLVRRRPGDRYVALSYVWGKGHEDRDLASTHMYEARRTDTGSLEVGKYQRQFRLPQHIPQTMEDAVTFVNSLGERYLWIDLYSIDQTDFQELAHQINCMDQIFASAHVTLICLDGQNADWGLPGVSRPLLQTQQPSIKLAAGQLTATFVFSTWHNNGTAIWDSRAWTLQERLLSPRCILFGKSHVAMACQKEYFHDAIPLTPNVNTWLSNEDEDDFREDGADINLDSPTWDFKTYNALVSVYTGRKLTDETDSLNACRGSLNRLSKSTNTYFIFGLPEKDFLRALLFSPHPENILHRRPNFPSWSWLGWSGRSTHPSWLREMADYLPATDSSTPLLTTPSSSTQARKKRRLNRSPSPAWHPTIAKITSFPTTTSSSSSSRPELHLTTALTTFPIRLLRHPTQPHKNLRTESQQSPLAIGTHFALLTSRGEVIRNRAGEHDNFEATDVSFRVSEEDAAVLVGQHRKEKGKGKGEGEVELMFVQWFPRIRDWKRSDTWLEDMVGALVVIRCRDEDDGDGNEGDGAGERGKKEGKGKRRMWRMASVLVERERWMAQGPRVEDVVLI